MIPELADLVMAAFVVFCRVGACLMVLPGFASQHIPPRIRLSIAVACSLCVLPQLLSAILVILPPLAVSGRIALVLSELIVGLLIGLLGRFMFLALEFMAAAIAMFLGYSGLPGAPVEESEPTGTLGSLLVMTAAVMIFAADLHLELVKGLVESYNVIEPGVGVDSGGGIQKLTTMADRSFALVLQLGAPFLVFSIVVNLMFGLLNKLTPMIPIYFISIPFVMFSGLLMMTIVIPEFMIVFIREYSNWIAGGSL